MHFTTVKQKSSAKCIEKKSSFFSYVYPITSIDEVKPLIDALRSKHKKANHVAYAYRLASLNKLGEIVFEERGNDDKEPNKTAGAPLLRLLQQQKLGNVLVCVARVFGGIKLGTAGLSKAYKTAGKEALDKTPTIVSIIQK
ncbi:YigZ family protein [Candidatus Woesearchaeota archaeon]|nr:YigZ family protein [Candidatus Woesearchaeota archaeon]